MFGMVCLNSNEFFTLRNQPHLCGHKYVINKQRCSSNRRINFFSNWIVNLWNNLPSSTTDFTSFRKFLTSHLITIIFYCDVGLNWIFYVICKLLFPTHDYFYILYTLSWTIIIATCKWPLALCCLINWLTDWSAVANKLARRNWADLDDHCDKLAVDCRSSEVLSTTTVQFITL